MEKLNNSTAPRNGIIQVIEQRDYYTVDDVKRLLGVEQSKAYKIIRDMRKEMIASGCLFDGYAAGKIPKSYFNDRCWIGK